MKNDGKKGKWMQSHGNIKESYCPSLHNSFSTHATFSGYLICLYFLLQLYRQLLRFISDVKLSAGFLSAYLSHGCALMDIFLWVGSVSGKGVHHLYNKELHIQRVWQGDRVRDELLPLGCSLWSLWVYNQYVLKLNHEMCCQAMILTDVLSLYYFFISYYILLHIVFCIELSPYILLLRAVLCEHVWILVPPELSWETG